MPKTKNAFAMRAIANIFNADDIRDEYEKIKYINFNGRFHVLDFKKHFYEGYVENSDDISQRVINFIARKVIKKLTNVPLILNVKQNFFKLKSYVDDLASAYETLEEARIRIDRHIGRLHHYQETILKFFMNKDAISDFEVQNFQYQIKRVKNLILWYSDIELNFQNLNELIQTLKQFDMSELTKLFAREFGERVRTVRIQRNLRQADVADALEIPLPTYSAYERGIREPPLYMIHRLTKFLQISVDYLFDTEN